MALALYPGEDIKAWARAHAVARDQATAEAVRALKIAGVPDDDPAYALIDTGARSFKLGLAAMCLSACIELDELPAPLAGYTCDMLPGQALIENRTGKS